VKNSYATGFVFEHFFPPVIVFFEQRPYQIDSAVVGCIDGVDGVVGNCRVVGLREFEETLGVAEFYGDDVLEELGYGLGFADVAREREDFPGAL
jgi:hypothetical protein